MRKVDLNKKYNLPEKVIFCKRCVISNQRPRIEFDEEGVCNACRYFDYKKNINWKEREKKLIKLLDLHRSKKGEYDCVVPSSGGKDSAYVAHELKSKYGMNPLTVTWSPLEYTDIGFKNLNSFNNKGFDIILGMANGEVRKKLCKESAIELGDPFQPFIYGQVLFPITIAVKYGIKLIFRGENAEAEYGGLREQWDKDSISVDEFNKIYFSNNPLNYWLKKGFTKKDLGLFELPEFSKIKELGVNSYFYGYFKNWSNHNNFYYAVQNTGFQPNTQRTEGTYTKYSSIDDKLDTFHHYFALLKFGHGRCTSNAAREVREGFINREEAVSLVKKYDEEFPNLFFKNFLSYTGLTEKEFYEIEDLWRNEKLWKKKGNKWVKKYPVQNL
jgi:N-acetyl sugar amidotransferase